MGGEEVDMIAGYLRPGMRVLEYGAGGSTIRFAPMVGEWYSVEHDPEWAKTTMDSVRAAAINNVQMTVIRPSPATKPIYAGSYTEEYLRAFHGYVSGAFVSKDIDAALIDGRSRLACARAALARLPAGGLIFFHDFLSPNRTRYRAFLKEAQMIDCIVRGQTLAVFQK